MRYNNWEDGDYLSYRQERIVPKAEWEHTGEPCPLCLNYHPGRACTRDLPEVYRNDPVKKASWIRMEERRQLREKRLLNRPLREFKYSTKKEEEWSKERVEFWDRLSEEALKEDQRKESICFKCKGTGRRSAFSSCPTCKGTGKKKQ